MNDELRKEIIQYRMESAKALLKEIDSHINNGFYNTAVNRMYYACFYSVSALLLHRMVDGVKTPMKAYGKCSESISSSQVYYLKILGSFIQSCSQDEVQPIMKIF